MTDSPNRQMRRWISPRDVSELTGHHPTTVRMALERGDLHGHQHRRHGRWNVRVDAVDCWMRGEDGIPACGCSEIARRRRGSSK